MLTDAIANCSPEDCMHSVPDVLRDLNTKPRIWFGPFPHCEFQVASNVADQKNEELNIEQLTQYVITGYWQDAN